MIYAVQVTQRIETHDKTGGKDRTVFVHSVLPCRNLKDAKQLVRCFDPEQPAIETNTEWSSEYATRSARIVTSIFLADNQKRVWVTLNGLEQIVSEYREEFNI